MDYLLKIVLFSFPAGRIFGIPLRINWLVLVLFVVPMLRDLVVVASGPASFGWMFVILMGTISFVVLYGSILLHELGHCWGMRLVGDTVQEIQLTPLGGVAIGEGPNRSPKTELIIVGLGPAVTAVLVILSWILSFPAQAALQSFPPNPNGASASAQGMFMVYLFIRWVFGLNMMLLLFNLLVPIFPLDSAKILRALLSLRWNPNLVTERMAKFGIGFGIVLFFASLFRIPLPIIGIGSPYLLLISLMGVQVCTMILQALTVQDVYTTYHGWGTQPVYFDEDVLAHAGHTARRDLLAAINPKNWLPRFGQLRRRGPVPVYGIGKKLPSSSPARKSVSKPRVAPAPAMFQQNSASASAPSAKRPAHATGELRLLSPDVSSLTDPAEIRRLMAAAAESEDFILAAQLKRRLQELNA